MFDRQLSKSRALISGTSSLRIILQRWSFNDINLYPCSCSKDNNHDHFSLWLRNAKKLKLFSHKKTRCFVRPLYIESREEKWKECKEDAQIASPEKQADQRREWGGGGGKFSVPHSSQHTSPLRIPIFKRLYFEWNALNHFFSKSASPALL